MEGGAGEGTGTFPTLDIIQALYAIRTVDEIDRKIDRLSMSFVRHHYIVEHRFIATRYYSIT